VKRRLLGLVLALCVVIVPVATLAIGCRGERIAAPRAATLTLGRPTMRPNESQVSLVDGGHDTGGVIR
jgi:hypothetical protein